jgi:peroxiredoxin (alkyl hydroperoxide reductase subunit C)
MGMGMEMDEGMGCKEMGHRERGHMGMGQMGMMHHMMGGREAGFPLIGDKFPQMEVKTTHGMMKLPDAFAGKWFVLFSHPADFTPVCTTEFVGFEKRRAEFENLNCELIGLSIDQVFSHMKWTQWIRENLNVEIKFPIIADDSGRVASRLGMIHPGKATNTVRAVFVVDPEATVRLIIFYPQEVGRNMDEIVRAVKALQTTDKYKVAAPANWPNNELIGDQVIIPPPADEKTAATRKTGGDMICEDWWFCHKTLPRSGNP